MADETEQAAASTAAAATATPETEQPVNLDAPAADQAAAPEGGEKPAKDAAETDADDDDDEGDPKRLSRHQRQQRRIARLEAELAARSSAPASEPRPRTIDDLVGPKPDPKDFANNAAGYHAAMAGYEAAKRLAGPQIEADKRAQAQAAEAHQRAMAAAYAEKQADAREKLPDYDAVVSAARLSVTPAAESAILDSEMTGEIEYHLAKNPTKLAELNRMSPQQAARYVGRLEAELSRPVEKKSTSAPAPVTRLTGGGAAPAKSLAELPMEEYAKARAAGRVR